MHIVVFAEKDSDPVRISKLLSETEIDSCDLYVQDWKEEPKIKACLGAIRNNFEGGVYILTKTLPVPSWVFDLDVTVSVLWSEQDPKDLALCQGTVEVDLYGLEHIKVIENFNNVSHFLTDGTLNLKKPSKIKKDRTVYGLSQDFFKLEII
jgi:hypothetical protein